MTLRFFADHCIPNSIIIALRDTGHHVFRVSECIPADSSDIDVISKVQELDSILVSLNGDFADIVAYPPGDYREIIAIQVRNHPEIIPRIMARLKDYLSTFPNMDHYKGKLLLAEIHRIRIRE